MPTKLFILSLMLLTLLASDFVQAKEPLIPAQTIASELEMLISVHYGTCGETPGTVDIPQSDTRF